MDLLTVSLPSSFCNTDTFSALFLSGLSLPSTGYSVLSTDIFTESLWKTFTVPATTYSIHISISWGTLMLNFLQLSFSPFLAFLKYINVLTPELTPQKCKYLMSRWQHWPDTAGFVLPRRCKEFSNLTMNTMMIPCSTLLNQSLPWEDQQPAPLIRYFKLLILPWLLYHLKLQIHFQSLKVCPVGLCQRVWIIIQLAFSTWSPLLPRRFHSVSRSLKVWVLAQEEIPHALGHIHFSFCQQLSLNSYIIISTNWTTPLGHF